MRSTISERQRSQRGGAIEDRPESYDRFCAVYYRPLVAMLTLHCGDRFLAEEFAQEALIRAGTHWGRVAGMAHPDRWLWRVGFNVANSFFRRKAAERRARDRLHSQRHELTEVDPSERVAVVQMLAKLGRRQRAVLILRYFSDLTFAEIADVLDIPVPTAKSLAQRGLARLRRDLERDNGREAASDAT